MSWMALVCVLACVEEGGFDPFAAGAGLDDTGVWLPYEAPLIDVAPRDVWQGRDLDAWQPGGWRSDDDLPPDRDDPVSDIFAGHPRAETEVCEPQTSMCPAAVGDVQIDWDVRVGEWDWFRYPAFSFADRERVAPSEWFGAPAPGEARTHADVPREGCDTLVLSGESGGSSCCSFHVVVTACGAATTITTIDASGNDGARGIEAVDADLDGAYELTLSDWSLSADPGGIVWWPPVAITRVLRWAPNGGWEVSPRGSDPEVYEAAASVAREGFYARTANERSHWTSGEGLLLALRAGGAVWLGGGSIEEVESIVRDSLKEGFMLEFSETQRAASEAPKLAADLARILDGYRGVRTVWASDGASDGF